MAKPVSETLLIPFTLKKAFARESNTLFMPDPATVAAAAQTTVKVTSAAVSTFKAARDASSGPVRVAMTEAEASVVPRFEKRPTVDIGLAIDRLHDAEAFWVLAFMVWKGHDIDRAETAERWADIAGSTLGMGERKIDTARDLVEAYASALRVAAAEGKGGRGFHEAQAQRRYRSIQEMTEDQTAALQAHGEDQSRVVLDQLKGIRASIEELNAGPDYSEQARALKERLYTAVDALNKLRLRSAIDLVEAVLDDLDAFRKSDPESEGAFVGLRQITLAVKGQAFALQGDVPAQKEVAGVLRERGPIVPEAVRPVALFAADIGDEDWLGELVPRLPAGTPEQPFLEVASDAMQNGRLDPEIVLDRTFPSEENANLLSLRIDALVNAVTPERAAEAVELIEALDTPEGNSADLLLPRKKLLVGQKSFHLLRRIVEKRLRTPDLDRQELIDSIRERLRQATEDLAALEDEYRGGHLEALVETESFLTFIEEFDAAELVHVRIRELQPEDGPIGAIHQRDVTTPEQIVQLEKQEVVSLAHRNVMKAHQSLNNDNPAQAKRRFGAALEEASTVGEREMALGDYVFAILQPPSPSIQEAQDLINEAQSKQTDEAQVRPDWLGVLSVRVAYARGSTEAAIAESDELLSEFPRSLILLRQKRSLLIREFIAEKKQLELGKAKTGRRKLQLAERLGQCAAAMYQILPAPTYLVEEGRSWAERGQGGKAWEFLRRAVRRGVQDEEVRRRVEG